MTKKCFVILERLDEKSLRKCLQKYGLKPASRNITETQPICNENKCQTYSRTKKTTKTNRKEINSDNFVLKRNYKRRRKRIKPLCYSDDETCNEISGTIANSRMRALSESEGNESYETPVKSEPKEVGCDKILKRAESRGEDAVVSGSTESEIQKERVKYQGKSELQLKNAVLSQHKNMFCGRTDKSQVSSPTENQIGRQKENEKPFNKKESTSLTIKKELLIVDSESVEKSELEDVCESREEDEDDRITVIFEKELHTDMDMEEIFEIEGKEINKKFKNREITNRKRHKLVKFKRKRMAGIKKTKAKVKRKSKDKLEEGAKDKEEIPEKSTHCVNEECLKDVCCLVKRLHDLSRIIYLLQRELPKNDDLTIHFNRVINSQLENFHKEIRKGQKTIIKCYEKMLTFYTDTSQVALEIGKRTSLSVEDVVNIISLCILIEGRCDADKSRNGGNQGPENPSDGLQKIINDNIVRIIKNKINQLEGLNGMERYQKVINSIVSHPSQCITQQMYQTTNKSTGFLHSQFKQQTLNSRSSGPSQSNTLVKQKKVDSTCFRPSQSGVEQKQERVNLIGFQSSQTNTQLKRKKLYSPGSSLSLSSMQQRQEMSNNIQSKQQITNDSTVVPASLINTQLKQQQIVTDSASFRSSQPKIQKKYPTVNSAANCSPAQFIPQPKRKTVSSYAFQQPDIQKQQQTVNKFTSFLPSQSNIQQKHTSTDFPDDLQKKNTSITKQHIVNVTGCPPSRLNIPSAKVNYRPELYHQPYERTSKPTEKGREETVYSLNRLMAPHVNPQIQIERPQQHRHFMFKNPGPGQVPQHGLNQRNQRHLGTVPPYPVDQTPKQNQPVVAGYPVHCGIPAQNVRRSQTINHEAPSKRNVPPANTKIPSTTLPVLGTLPRYDCPSNQVSESVRNSITTDKVVRQNGAFHCVTTNNYSRMKGTKQVTTTDKGQCPLTDTEATFLIRVLGHDKLYTVPVDLPGKHKTNTEVENSEVQQVLDPTIPQKLTMRNSRLQAGPVLEAEEMTAKMTEKSILPSKEAGNFYRKNSQSRVYVCAENDCKNPGVRVCNCCRSVIYCSATCQRRHWTLKHKAECYQLKELRG